jgi:plasmid stabilization system protein ParE
MAKRIIWSREAVADRIQILDYWYKRLGDKRYSARLDEQFRRAVRLISIYPGLGRRLDDRKERFFVTEFYQIFFIEDEDTIRILHIWDTRRDPDEFPV